MAMMRVSRTAGRVVTPTRCTCAHPYSPCAVRAMMSVSPSPLKSAAISGMTGGCGSHSVDSGRPCSETTTAAEAPAARTVVGGPCVWRDRGMSVGAEAAGPSWCHASGRVSCHACSPLSSTAVSSPLLLSTTTRPPLPLRQPPPTTSPPCGENLSSGRNAGSASTAGDAIADASCSAAAAAAAAAARPRTSPLLFTPPDLWPNRPVSPKLP
mmetsp:Transcript_12269/g.33501  ORF Transcript_12269/g.33501 Transcript_12269/m.33501 type:complete len:211 (-) Transcript_12269:1794-2426(-)